MCGSISNLFIILSAVSTDGLTWTKEPGIRVDIGEMGTYDCQRVENQRVIEVLDGRYIMFYVGTDAAGSGRILSAVSTDELRISIDEPG